MSRHHKRLALKLPRTIVLNCTIQRPSKSFSHRLHLAGKQLILFCTGDHGGVIKAFEGKAEPATQHGSRNWVFVPARTIHPRELDRLDLERV